MKILDWMIAQIDYYSNLIIGALVIKSEKYQDHKKRLEEKRRKIPKMKADKKC